MTEGGSASGILYSQDGETLLEVPNQKTIVISNKAKYIFGSSETNYAFQGSANTLTSFSFMPNPELQCIQSFAFFKCSKLTEIDLSKCTKLTEVQNSAFQGCTLAKTLIFPVGSLKLIGNYGFNSVGASTVTIPSSVQDIGSAFYSSQLTSVTFTEPCNITSFKWGAFSQCKLTSIHIPKSVTFLNGEAFENTELSTVTVDIDNPAYKAENNVIYTKDGTSIRYCAKYGKTSFEVPVGVLVIEYSAFSYNQMTSVTLPKGLKTISSYAFFKSKIQSIVIPASVENIFTSCFQRTPITSAVFEEPSNLTTIKEYAFAYCSNLQSVQLPSSIKTIEGGVFMNCPKGISITFDENSDYIYDVSTCLITSKDKKIISNYIGSEKDHKIVIPEEATTISNGCFDQQNNLISIKFQGNKLTTIGNNAFRQCNRIVDLQIPESVTKIGREAFSDSSIKSIHLTNVISIDIRAFSRCHSLTTVQFDSITIIPRETFTGCNLLSSFTVGSGLTAIGEKAFYQCSALTSFSFISSIATIDINAFEESGLTEVVISEGTQLTRIEHFVFNNCKDLSSVTLASTINYLGIQAFSGISLTSLVLPNGIETIDRSCFEMADKLETFTIQEGSALVNINDYAFRGCTALRKIFCESNNFVIDNDALFDSGKTKLIVFPPSSPFSVFCFPQTVTHISVGAFSCAKNLVVIAIPEESIQVIGMRAFENCTQLRMINIPACVTDIGDDAFINCKSISCGQAIDVTDALKEKLVKKAKFPRFGLKNCRIVCSNGIKSPFTRLPTVFLYLTLFLNSA